MTDFRQRLSESLGLNPEVQMLLRLLAFACLAAGVVFAIAAFVTEFSPIMLGLAVQGVLGYAVLSALGEIVDHLESIAKHTHEAAQNTKRDQSR
ncbi:hypothetical protein [Palleronia caenipelagi]|uniref:DUF4282 domain-containing protein n=1 Tax=Palleronia caenipelagi TaxID=2489174 RepID=A0A547Q669_9RHOB|nr:hypothetical protein [Palleronia caenipelagi]TRD21886.1 hypothetical protein FEV53_07505 [Palleronia caenipelagi]